MRISNKGIVFALVVATASVGTTAVAQGYGNRARAAAAAVATEAGVQLNLVETAAAAGSFKTLLAAAQAAGLAETLSTGGPFTVFAPTDEAFKKLPDGTVESLLANPEQLKQILLFHVVSGNVKAADVVNLTSAKTLQGQNVTVAVEEGKVKINGATVTKTDIAASNGVIHVIDTVILPKTEKNIVETAVSAGTFTTLAAALSTAGLVDTLKGDGPFTVFAPTDLAFRKLPAGTVENLLKPENKDQLTAILLAHVVPGNIKAEQVVGLKEAKTVGGNTLPIEVKEGVVHIGGSKVVNTDITASNGVIHVIDSVIIP